MSVTAVRRSYSRTTGTKNHKIGVSLLNAVDTPFCLRKAVDYLKEHLAEYGLAGHYAPHPLTCLLFCQPRH